MFIPFVSLSAFLDDTILRGSRNEILSLPQLDAPGRLIENEPFEEIRSYQGPRE
jgi:hypothetical protein